MALISGLIGTGLSLGGLFLPKGTTNNRSFAGFTGLMTISEQSRDTIAVTSHPVEDGSVISDHAYVQPKQVTISFGYGAGTLSVSSIGGLIDKGAKLIAGGENPFSFSSISLSDMYDKILKLQSDRVPLTLVTGKRKYSNMLIESISNETNSTSENILLLEISLIEVIIVHSKITELSKDKQADASKTGQSTNAGKKQLGS